MTAASSLYITDQANGLVDMFDVDLTMFGGSLYHLSPSMRTTASFAFGGVTYLAFPIALTDVELNSNGTLPQPTLTVGTVENKLLAAAMGTYGDLVGMKITRRRTYTNYLDGAADEDSTAHTFIERYTAIQVGSRTKSQIVWKLATPIDLPNVIIPGTQYLKDPGNLSGPSDTSQGITRNVYAPGLSRILSS